MKCLKPIPQMDEGLVLSLKGPYAKHESPAPEMCMPIAGQGAVRKLPVTWGQHHLLSEGRGMGLTVLWVDQHGGSVVP